MSLSLVSYGSDSEGSEEESTVNESQEKPSISIVEAAKKLAIKRDVYPATRIQLFKPKTQEQEQEEQEQEQEERPEKEPDHNEAQNLFLSLPKPQKNKKSKKSKKVSLKDLLKENFDTIQSELSKYDQQDEDERLKRLKRQAKNKPIPKEQDLSQVLPKPQNLPMGSVHFTGSRLDMSTLSRNERQNDCWAEESQSYESDMHPNLPMNQDPLSQDKRDPNTNLKNYESACDYTESDYNPSNSTNTNNSQVDPIAAAFFDRKTRRKMEREGQLIAPTVTEIKQEKLLYKRPGEAEVQSMAVPSKPHIDGKVWNPSSGNVEHVVIPSRTQKRKHQITWLLYDAQVKEQDLLMRRGETMKTKAQTQARYGW